VTKMIQEILKTLLLLFQQSCRLHALVYVKKDREMSCGRLFLPLASSR
jgi:hypothetical protein